MPKKENPKNDHPVEKIFSKIGEKTGVDKKKVDGWQKKWLAVPKNRTKYEGLKDAPMVMGEEIFAMTNDIIEFAQGEHGEESHVFKKLKKEGSSFLKSPAKYLQEQAEKGKGKAMEAKKLAEKKATKTKKPTK
ncbi:hypothetical protein KAR91_19410 [Candidatus Pacearchaeota archaeon]|nr:hypothetical protein [Candidatus Pacearchaeota archaeon]